MNKSVFALALGLASIPGLHLLSSDVADVAALPAMPKHARYEISVTNITRSQIFSPPVIVTHNRRMDPIFSLGEPASAELAGVAEDALNKPLMDMLKKDRNVKSVQMLTGVNGPILPGETAKIVVEGGGWFNQVSMVGMLVITNDAFFGLSGMDLPRYGGKHVRSPAYDAGSEANNEKCAYIPGPPCGSAMVRMTAGAEGYVHVHAGIHGVGDLAAADYDWRSDVAMIRVRRVK